MTKPIALRHEYRTENGVDVVVSKTKSTVVKRNSRRFEHILNNIQTATVIGGGDPHLNTTVKMVVAACRANKHFKLSANDDGTYKIEGESCSWTCTF